MFHTLMVGGIAHLEVYRSLQLPADHEWLAPANELLSRFDHDVVSCEVVDDSTMWMCTAERVLYLLKPPPEAA